MTSSIRRRIWQGITNATPLPTLMRPRGSGHWQQHWREKMPTEVFPRYATATPLKKWFAQRVVDLAPRSVLELGCNVGANLREIHAIDPTISLHGIELNERAIEWGRKNSLPTSAHVVWGSMADTKSLTAGIDDIDIVFTSAAAMHCDDDIFASAKQAALSLARKAIVHLEFNAWTPADLHNGRNWRSSFLSDRWIRDYAGEYADSSRVESIETRGIPLNINFMDNIGRIMISDVTGLVVVRLKER